MSISIPDFWKLAIDRKLLTLEQCQKLGAAFGYVKGAATQGNTPALVEWLIAEGVLTRYQATALLAGKNRQFVHGQYKIAERIKQGPLVGAFRAVHMPSQHPVLLQFITGPAAGDAAQWTRVVRQAHTTCTLAHPNLARCYELMDLGQAKFSVLEVPRGECVCARVEQSGAPPASEACRLVRQAALGLAQMHAAGMVHGEVRPDRLWIEPGGNVKLVLGPLARVPFTPAVALNLSSADPQTLLAADYAAPEMGVPGRAPDLLTDVYSLGATLYHLLSGRVPFPGGDARQKLTRHAMSPIAPLDPAGVPPELGQIVAYMMAKDPSLRYQNATAVAEVLAPFVESNLLHLEPEPPLSTQAAFDAVVRKRQAAVAEQVAGQDASAATADTAAAAVPIVIQTDKPSAAVDESAVAVLSKSSAIDSETRSASGRLKSRRSRGNRNLLIGSLGLGLALIVGAVVLGLRGCGDATSSSQAAAGQGTNEGGATGKTTAAAGEMSPKGGATTSLKPPLVGNADNSAGKVKTVAVARAPRENVILVDDDGQTLWVSPTAGGPLELNYVPFGAQVVIVTRPADILRGTEGQMAFEGLGPFAATVRAYLESTAGVPLEEIEQLIVSVKDQNEQPTISLVVRTTNDHDDARLLAAWGNPSPVEHEGKTFYTRGSQAYVIADKRRFAVASSEDVREMLASDGAPPNLLREIETLAAAGDDRRHVSILFNPSYLRNRGHLVFPGYSRALGTAVDRFLGAQGEVRAGMLSLQFDPDTFFGEIRLCGDPARKSDEFAKDFFARWQKVPLVVRNLFKSMKVSDYSNNLLYDYPRMIEEVVKATRWASEGEQAVMRFYVRPRAGQHLVMGTELALLENSGVATGGPATTAVTTTAPKTVQEKLRKTITLEFPQLSLEKALEEFGREVGLAVAIVGVDFQLEGITRNQQIRSFSAKDQPADAVLRQILLKANPDPETTGPDDPRMKLVYVVRPGNGGGEMIYIATREGAAKRSEKIPPEFEVKKRN